MIMLLSKHTEILRQDPRSIHSLANPFSLALTPTIPISASLCMRGAESTSSALFDVGS